MKTSIYILAIVLSSSLPLLADDNFDKDIQDTLASIRSVFYTQRQEKMDIETERLVKKYGAKMDAPMAALAVEPNDMERQFGLAALVKLGPCDSVKQTFLNLLKNSDSRVRNDALCALAKIDKDFARDIAVNAVDMTTDPNVKMSIIPLLGVIGDSNTLVILQGLEKDHSKNFDIRKVAHQAQEYIESRLNLPTQDAHKSWADQAYAYWSVFKEVENQPYRSSTGTYYAAAFLMKQRGYKFSRDFLKYHLNQKDPLAIAVISVQGDKDAIEDLKTCKKKDGNDVSLFDQMCRKALRNIELQQLKGLRKTVQDSNRRND